MKDVIRWLLVCVCPSNSKPFLKLAEISPGPVTAISDGLALLQSIFFPVTNTQWKMVLESQV